MRQWGADYRRFRVGWRHPNFRFRVRPFDECAFLRTIGFDCRGTELDGVAPPPGNGIPPPPGLPGGPEEEELGGILGRLPRVGIGCPSILTQLSWQGLEPLTRVQLESLGAFMPGPGTVSFFQVDATIWQFINRRPDQAIEFRKCDFVGSAGEAQGIVNELNATPQADLMGFGFFGP